MSAGEQHLCTVQLTAEGAPFLAFEPSSGVASRYTHSLVTLDLRPGVDFDEARQLAAQINALLWGVSATIF